MTLRRLIALVAIAPVFAAAMVFAASWVPDRLILDELASAAERSDTVLSFESFLAGRGVDSFSDCLALTMGLGETEGSALTVWVRSPTLGSCEPAIASIRAYDAGEGLSGGYEYYRYWHGYTVVSRPLVATVGGTGQRVLLLWAMVGAIVLLARRIARHHGLLASFALLVPLLFTTDTIELSRTVPFGLAALVAILGAWWLHRLNDPPESTPLDPRAGDLGTVAGAFVVGGAYVFVDLLTNPPGAWALSTGVAALSAARSLSGRALVRRAAAAGVGWIVGWVWIWVSKWVIAAAILGWDEVRSNISGAIDERVAGERPSIDLSPFNAIEVNVRTWFDHPMTPVVLVGVALTCVWVFRRQDWTSTWMARLVIAAPAVLPLIWFEVLRNHSLVHPQFVNRSLGVSAGLIALAMIVAPRSLRGLRAASRSADAPSGVVESATFEAEQADHERREHELGADRHR